MMKFVCLLTGKYGVPTVASLNSIMVDGDRDVRSLHGCLSLTRKLASWWRKHACIDGPELGMDTLSIGINSCPDSISSRLRKKLPSGKAIYCGYFGRARGVTPLDIGAGLSLGGARERRKGECPLAFWRDYCRKNAHPPASR
ncbi:putative bifunctional glutamate synthase subunit beta/2-polyprenylphenol hydroxylase [Mobiluncus holmesii]|nr:putative bifunctional glutamate synthase subunit beta/2-polyprenylphenol hydroxylase [Mobiluncus holmesii]